LELSFLSERFTQLKKELQEDLFSSSVLADYFLPKCSIFARNNLHGDEKHLFDKVYDIIETNFPQPDLLVYLYVETPRLLKNIQSRGRSYEQHITAEYLDDIQQQYLLYFKQHPNLPVLMINTTLLDFKTDELAYTRLQEHINQSYPPGITRITL
jgi:deoxyadenosine/deoxycytidine kinase